MHVHRGKKHQKDIILIETENLLKRLFQTYKRNEQQMPDQTVRMYSLIRAVAVHTNAEVRYHFSVRVSSVVMTTSHIFYIILHPP